MFGGGSGVVDDNQSQQPKPNPPCSCECLLRLSTDDTNDDTVRPKEETRFQRIDAILRMRCGSLRDLRLREWRGRLVLSRSSKLKENKRQEKRPFVIIEKRLAN